jgi:hypothetical protein
MILKREVSGIRAELEELENSLNIKMENQTEILITEMREMFNHKRNQFEEMSPYIERENELHETKMVNKVRMHSDNTDYIQKMKDEKVDFASKKKNKRHSADITKK